MGKSANTQIWTESGIKLVLTNKKEAMVFFRQAIKLNPKSAAGFFDRGVSYQRLEKHDQAVSEYDRAIELDPQNFQAHFNRGVAHQTLGNLEKAVQDFKRAVELRPDYAQAYCRSCAAPAWSTARRRRSCGAPRATCGGGFAGRGHPGTPESERTQRARG